MTNKRLCEGCGWHGDKSDLLSASNPFAPDEPIYGCPKCLQPDSGARIMVACDESGCWDPVSVGTPTSNGYRNTCDRHAPRGWGV